MRFATISTFQLFFMALLIGVIAALLVCVNTWYMIWTQLPVEHVDHSGACVKIENFENGQAFNCNDVDVLLRRYRKSAS